MPVSKATRASLHTYALDRYSANGDISIGSKVLSELINDLILLEAREARLRAAITRALDACPYCQAKMCTAPAPEEEKDE